MNKFEFSQEQKDKFLKFKEYLNSEEHRRWTEQETKAIEEVDKILNDSKFKEGNDLTSDQLDKIFSLMRNLANNRILTKNLYEKNGIGSFNKRLRTLLCGTQPLRDRINQFFELDGVGEVTVSHFLCVYDRKEFPVISNTTLNILNLTDEQIKVSDEIADEEFGITNRSEYHQRTLTFLGDYISFRELKNLLGVEYYTDVNNVLWLEYEKTDEEVISDEPFTSIGLEADLRDYLGKNLHLIEKGLILIQKEYPLPSGRRIDILCKDVSGTFVVIETKRDRSGNQVIGQILSYVGELEKQENKKVRGFIILYEENEKLNNALYAVRDMVKIKYYQVKFELFDKPNPI